MSNGKDVRDIQKSLLDGHIYKAVVETELAIRHRSEYDLGTAEERRFAILCWALQKSAEHTQGTCLTLAGVFRGLAEIQEAAK